MEITIFHGKIRYKWQFSIAMFVSQRVHQQSPRHMEMEVIEMVMVTMAQRGDQLPRLTQQIPSGKLT